MSYIYNIYIYIYIYIFLCDYIILVHFKFNHLQVIYHLSIFQINLVSTAWFDKYFTSGCLQEPISNLVKENLQVISPKLEKYFDNIRWLLKEKKKIIP
jgi:hypothetical protein